MRVPGAKKQKPLDKPAVISDPQPTMGDVIKAIELGLKSLAEVQKPTNEIAPPPRPASYEVEITEREDGRMQRAVITPKYARLN